MNSIHLKLGQGAQIVGGQYRNMGEILAQIRAIIGSGKAGPSRSTQDLPRPRESLEEILATIRAIIGGGKPGPRHRLD